MFEPVNDDHIWQLAHNMHPDDVAEVRDGCGLTPAQALIQACRSTRYPLAYVDEGVVIAMLGCGEHTSLIGERRVGIPWMLASRQITSYGKPLVKSGRELTKFWSEDYDILQNYVDVRHERACRWLKAIGYTLDEPTPYGPLQLPFHRFWRRGCVQ